MASFNQVVLVGNLSRDISLSYLPSQKPVGDTSIAVNEKWIGQDGQPREDVSFIDLRFFGKSAETVNKYCRKGSPLLVAGKLKQDTWQAKDGSKRSKLYVIVNSFQFIGGKREEQSHPQDDAQLPNIDDVVGGQETEQAPLDDSGVPF